MLQIKEVSFTVSDIYSLYKGEKRAKEYNVIEHFERRLKRLKRLVDNYLQRVTYDKYSYSKMHVANFIRWKYKTKNIPLKPVKSSIFKDF